MERQYLVDTNAAIDYLDNKLPGNSATLIYKSVTKISIISRMELFFIGLDQFKINKLLTSVNIGENRFIDTGSYSKDAKYFNYRIYSLPLISPISLAIIHIYL